MSLLSPAMLAGLVALAIPVLAHLLGRETPKRIPFAAMRFLPAVEPVVSRRRTLRDLPLLLVRLLALALLVLVLARPATTRDDEVTVFADAHDAVFLLDNSRSMNLRVDGTSLFDAGLAKTRELVRSLPPGSTAGFVTSQPGGTPVPAAETTGAVLDALETLETQPASRRSGAVSLAEALPAALGALGPSRGDRRRVIYAIGDPTATGLGSLPNKGSAGVAVIPISLVDAGATTPEHVAIEEVVWERAPEIDPRAVRLRVVVGRHGGSGEAGSRTLEVALEVDDNEVTRAAVDVETNAKGTLAFTHTLAATTGAVAATVRLANAPDDPLPDDDAYHLWLSADREMEILVVNGDPSEIRVHDETFFLSTAVSTSDTPLRLRSLAPDQLAHRIRESGDEALAEVDVLVLANAAAPTDDVARTIGAAVGRGMGLWITSGDRVEAATYNERFGKLLPLLLREAVVLGTAPGQVEAKVEGIVPTSLAHPILQGLSGDVGLGGARVKRAILLEPDADRDAASALSFTHGAPALITSDRTGGRVAFLATTADRDWTDLPLHPGFVPLAQRTLAFLADGPGASRTAHITAGQPWGMATDRPLGVRTPDARQLPLTAGADGKAVLDDTAIPGHYRVYVAGDQSTEVASFSAVVDPAESDTTPVEIQAGEDVGDKATVTATSPAWRLLALLIAILLGIESILRLRATRA